MPQGFVPRLILLASVCLPLPVSAQTVEQARHQTVTLPSDQEDRLVSVVVTPGLSSNSTLDEDLKVVRSAMHAGEDVSPKALRALADMNDGLAAQRYVRFLETLDPPANPSEIAHYATIAVSTGRIWTLPDAIEAMHLLDPATEPPERIGAYIEMLYAHAWAGNSLALDAVIDLNGEGRLFGALSEATRAKILEQDQKNGDGRAALRMALTLLMDQPLSTADSALAIEYLNLAAAADNFQVSVTASNLLALQTDGSNTVVSQ